MSLGQVCAQLVHASGESSPGNLPENTHAVVLGVENEAKLLALERDLILLNIPHRAIREPDPPFNGALTAIGIVPAPKPSVKHAVSNLKLLKELT